MATETSTKNEKAAEADKPTPEGRSESTEETDEGTARVPAATESPEEGDGVAEEAGYEELPAADEGRSGFGAGAVAVVSAGLGVVSLTGNSLGEMLRERKQLMGQLESQAQQMGGGGGAGDQMNSLFGAPWHAAALVNGIFALLAVLLGGLLLAVVAKRAGTGSWVKAVALGGVLLGLVGLVVAGGMYFDILAPQPEIPGAS
ncbi:hypothetical protein [Streptomyces sp. HNM0574]|uniref:hypothetical protein n=1 Tax=Streptomyces sp. HNM0574 TaxID=2714954 RepID=UPI00146B39EB|nr:hypothetical protein [Streptomyces sp. HNM0574]NLU66999.1 hypothetical protein [Streptomyces sp. HNM0574]